jgi:hypothetical protein
MSNLEKNDTGVECIANMPNFERTTSAGPTSSPGYRGREMSMHGIACVWGSKGFRSIHDAFRLFHLKIQSRDASPKNSIYGMSLPLAHCSNTKRTPSRDSVSLVSAPIEDDAPPRNIGNTISTYSIMIS